MFGKYNFYSTTSNRLKIDSLSVSNNFIHVIFRLRNDIVFQMLIFDKECQGVDFFGKIHISYLFHKISLLNIFPIFSFMKKKEKWLRKMMINTLLSEVHLLSAGYYTYSWKHVTRIIFIQC